MTDTINWNDTRVLRERAYELWRAGVWAKAELGWISHDRLLATLALADGDYGARAALKRLAKRERRLREDIEHFGLAEQQIRSRLEFVEASQRAAANTNSEAA